MYRYTVCTGREIRNGVPQLPSVIVKLVEIFFLLHSVLSDWSRKLNLEAMYTQTFL